MWACFKFTIADFPTTRSRTTILIDELLEPVESFLLGIMKKEMIKKYWGIYY